MTTRTEVATALGSRFSRTRADLLVQHFHDASDAFQRRAWETCLVKAGKFVEAVLKTLAHHAQVPVGKGRRFKVDVAIRTLEQTPDGSHDDTIRLTIPRACRFAYEIASNRGGRHDPDGIDPNEMDASVLVGLCSWILADMVRYSQKGTVTPEHVHELVAGLVARKYPVVELVDGRWYFHAPNRTAPDVILVLLLQAYPGRLSRGELIAAAQRHGITENAAYVALTRLKAMLDDDGNGSLRLLAPGVSRAERVVEAAIQTQRKGAHFGHTRPQSAPRSRRAKRS